jgi:hypothetical protein
VKLPQPPPQLTAVEFNAALREAGFGVEHARIVDVSGRCPGFVTTPAFRGRGVIDRPRTLAKAIRERDAEIARRGARPTMSEGDRYTLVVRARRSAIHPRPWGWEICRDAQPLPVRIRESGFKTEHTATLAGKVALRDFLAGLADEQSKSD